MKGLKLGLLGSCALLAAGAFSGGAHAQAGATSNPPPDPAGNAVEEVVVTGSLIRGTPVGGPLPVEVIGADELQKQGAPSVLALIKNLPASSGVLGDTNQFDSRAQGSEGSGSINLRGLGPQRTLVLLNGRRLTINPFGVGGAGNVDTNMLPVAAIDRVEVLKDGAAATYGSDAIAGVVNFITRRGFEGFDVGANYKGFSGSDGDYDAHVTYGAKGDRFDFLLSAAYEHRSELNSTARDFANRPYLQNPEGGWSGAGNPAPFVSGAAAAAGVQRDPQCGALGSYPGFSGATPLCYFHYINYDNLVEEENRYQLFGQLNFDLTPQHHFHGEVLVGQTDVPEWNTSPSYAALIGPTADAFPAGSPFAPTGGRPGNYYVPPTSPGLIDYVSRYPQFASLAAAGGLLIPATFRPYGVGGNPLFGNGASIGSRSYTEYRISGGFNGDLPFWGLGYDINATYSKESARRTGYDTLVDRFELALRGLGGPACDFRTGTPGQGGCLYFNPFSTAIAGNVQTGQTNPQSNPALANSAALTSWFFQKLSTEQEADLFTVEGAVSGKTPIVLPGGAVSFALGGQYRRNSFSTDYNNLSNFLVTPCLNTPDFGITNCAAGSRVGGFMFLAPSTPANLDNSIYAFFGELQIPITDTLKAQFAARFEDYGGQTGSTFDPKLSVRWQAIPQFALRGSIGTTFRGPPLSQLTNSPVTAFSSIGGSFRAVDITGNAGLQPESATTFSVGGVLKLGGLNATVDYWSIDIDKGIVGEPAADLVTAFSTSTAACTDPGLADLRSRFVFSGGSCLSNPSGTPNLTTLSRLETFYVNGPKVKTEGIDFLTDWKLPYEVLGGKFVVGASVSYVLSYDVSGFKTAGVNIPGYSAVGFLNYLKTAYPIPEWKGSFYAEYRNGPHNLRATVRHIAGYDDERGAVLTRPGGQSGTARDSAGNLILVPGGASIDNFTTVDLDYRVILPYETTLTLGIDNIADQDPPFARLDLSYDPFTANALGRVFKIGINKKF